ncbi:MAG: TetR/AcrR family transcriptional regulator [Archangium sp.]
MPRPRYENLEADKKQRLMHAAMTEFGRHGYELASMNRILDEAGFSKGSFYYYFDDKLDLAAATLLHAGTPLMHLGEIGNPTSIQEFWDELRRVSLFRLKNLETRRVEFDCLSRLGAAMAKNPELMERVMPVFGPARMKMMEFLQRGQQLGALRADLPVPTYVAMLEAAKISAFSSMFPEDRPLSDAELESFTDFMLDLAQRIGSPPKGTKS